jgi:Uma2 family endonuclease
MATIPSPPWLLGADAEPEYPTGDGRPMGETPLHRDNLITAVRTLDRHFADQPLVYVSGNMFVYYEKGNRHKHVSPDVFVALGVPKETPRDNYLIWEEGHGLDLVIELTSKSTKDEDIDDKMAIYRDEMPVPEYFLFDPKGDYLDPPLQGHRLREGKYVPIEMVEGRLPSEVVGLHLERDGEWLRFYNCATGLWLPTPEEREAALERAHERAETERQRAEADRQREQAARERAEAERERAEAERERAEAERERAEAERERLAAELEGSGREVERLRQELEEWRRRFGEK